MHYLAPLGIGGILAAFMFVFYRQDMKSSADLWHGQSDALLKVVKENTEAITALRGELAMSRTWRREDRIEDRSPTR